MTYIYLLMILILIILVVNKQVQIIQLKMRLQNMERLKKEIYQLCENVSKSEDKDRVFSLILDAAIALIGRSTKGSILMLEDDGDFHFKALRGFSEKVMKLTIKKEENYLFKINNFKETAIMKNPKKFDENTIDKDKTEELKKYEALDIYSTLTSPIYIDGQLIGTINIDSEDSERDFTGEDIKTINYIKHELELALRNFLTQDKLRYMADYDDLTGLLNRRSFKKRLSSEIRDMNINNDTAWLVLIDLDDFKNINDTYGHNAGDEALVTFSEILRNHIGGNDVYARMSGDEFVILFRSRSADDVRNKMDMIREVFGQRKIGSVNLSFSYGLCEIIPQEELSLDTIFGIADRNMYNDKKLKYCKR